MDVLREQMKTVQRDIKEIKDVVNNIDNNQRQLSSDFLVACEQNEHRDQQIKENKERINKIEEAIKPMIFAYKVLAWVGSILGLSIIALLWAIFTGQVTLGF